MCVNLMSADDVQNDSMIARLLFSSLLSALLNKFDSELTKKDAAEMMAKVNAGITKMLSTTTQFFAPFIACLLVCSFTIYLVFIFSIKEVICCLCLSVSKITVKVVCEFYDIFCWIGLLPCNSQLDLGDLNTGIPCMWFNRIVINFSELNFDHGCHSVPTSLLWAEVCTL